MADLLIRLYDLERLSFAVQRDFSATIRRACAPEKEFVLQWVQCMFPREGWRSETSIAFTREPISCVLAVRQHELLGFLCYNATMKGFIGPGGISPNSRRQGLFTALVREVCTYMRCDGYGYAIAGDVGNESAALLISRLDALVIPTSEEGVYRGMLRESNE
jgi:hypothetical protein